MLALRLFITSLLALASAVPTERWANDPSDNVPSGYVTTKGTEFWLDHYPFYFNGANAYWIPQLVYDYQYQEAFDLLKELGVKVLRTWAFSMVEDTLPTTNVTYYQVSLASCQQIQADSTSSGQMGLACRSPEARSGTS